MIRMVNLTCPKCGMSLDVDVESLESYCPNCGGKLYISVPQAIDVFEQKKMIKRKNVKYATMFSDVKSMKETKKSGLDAWTPAITILSILLIITMIVLIWYFIYGMNNYSGIDIL